MTAPQYSVASDDAATHIINRALEDVPGIIVQHMDAKARKKASKALFAAARSVAPNAFDDPTVTFLERERYCRANPGMASELYRQAVARHRFMETIADTFADEANAR